ncbi:hypothetical protein WG66_002569 [Moniliophthora roreri]|nr:hypothetical protein WG66_002569 [Moniliophthora roreri]
MTSSSTSCTCTPLRNGASIKRSDESRSPVPDSEGELEKANEDRMSHGLPEDETPSQEVPEQAEEDTHNSTESENDNQTTTTYHPSEELQNQFCSQYYGRSRDAARAWLEENGQKPCERCEERGLQCIMPPNKGTTCTPCATGSRVPCSKTEGLRRALLTKKFNLDAGQYEVLRNIFYERRRKNAEDGSEETDDTYRSPGDGEEDSGQSEKEDSDYEKEKVTAKKRKNEEVPNAQRKASKTTKPLSTSTTASPIEAHSHKPLVKAATRAKHPETGSKVGAHRKSDTRTRQVSSTQKAAKPAKKGTDSNTNPRASYIGRSPNASGSTRGSSIRRPPSPIQSECSTLVNATAPSVSVASTRPTQAYTSSLRALKCRLQDTSSEFRYKRATAEELLKKYDMLADEIEDVAKAMEVDG